MAFNQLSIDFPLAYFLVDADNNNDWTCERSCPSCPASCASCPLCRSCPLSNDHSALAQYLLMKLLHGYPQHLPRFRNRRSSPGDPSCPQTTCTLLGNVLRPHRFRITAARGLSLFDTRPMKGMQIANTGGWGELVPWPRGNSDGARRGTRGHMWSRAAGP